jgi:hypothetical protein
MWIPDGPWSDVMSFLLMNKKDFEERKEIEHYKQMTPKTLHFDNPELCDHAYNICKKLKNWDVTHKCCDKKGFMVHDNELCSMRMRPSFNHLFTIKG